MSFGRVTDIIYYVTAKGLVALSLDEGETIILSSGKRMPPTEVWEETSDDLEASLSDKQKTLLVEARKKKPMTEIEALAWAHRKRERHDKRAYTKGPKFVRELGENVAVVKSDLED